MRLTDWMDRLPEGWKVKPLRHMTDYRISSVDKRVKGDEFPVRLCNYTDVYHNEFIRPDMDFMYATATKTEIDQYRLLNNDVVITKDSESWDDIGVPALAVDTFSDLVCGYHLALLHPRDHTILGPFLFRCLQTRPVQMQLELAATGVTRFGLSKFSIGTLLLPVPPLEVQRSIVMYIDRETAKLDSIISTQEGLLELLAEKHHALITNAVGPSRKRGMKGCWHRLGHYVTRMPRASKLRGLVNPWAVRRSTWSRLLVLIWRAGRCGGSELGFHVGDMSLTARGCGCGAGDRGVGRGVLGVGGCRL